MPLRFKGQPGRRALKVDFTTKRFNREVQRLMRRAGGWAGDLVRKIMFDLMMLVIFETPVKTGHARAGWLAIFEALGMPEPDIGGSDPAAKAEGRRKSTAAAYLRGKRAWARVTNAVAYIVYLEFGHSTNAGQGMLRKSMIRMRAHFRQYLRDHPLTRGARL